MGEDPHLRGVPRGSLEEEGVGRVRGAYTLEASLNEGSGLAPAGAFRGGGLVGGYVEGAGSGVERVISRMSGLEVM